MLLIFFCFLLPYHSYSDKVRYQTLCFTPIAISYFNTPGWNEKQLNGSTMRDRSDDSSHHERNSTTVLRLAPIIMLNKLARESHSSQWSTTGVTKAEVCAILSMGWCI